MRIEPVSACAQQQGENMRSHTQNLVAQLPARKRAALIMLVVLVCGGMVASVSAWS
jgi:hypothetical protein